jgi:PQQ-dependent catabolism-associated CXXCW motif protein
MKPRLWSIIGAASLATAVVTMSAAQDRLNDEPQPRQTAAPPQDHPPPPGANARQPGPDGRNAAVLDQLMQAERRDFGIQPTSQLYAGAMHAPTPASIPGGQVITTKGLVALVQGKQLQYFLFDALGGQETLPAAIPAAWASQPGSFNDQIQQQFSQLLRRHTQGRTDVPLVFYCLSTECWMSYNVSLRAINAGYKNVLWYRGGVEAWKAAGLPTQRAVQPGFPQQQ